MPSLNFFRMGMSAPDVASRFMGIYEAQFRGLRQAGAEVEFTLSAPNPAADFVICTASAADIHRAAAETDRPLILYVPPADQWFVRPLLTQYRARICFAYGPVLSHATRNAYYSLGIAYHYLPFAADPELMRPLQTPALYDLVFLGGLQHRKGYQPYIEPLLKKLDPARLCCLGAGWSKYNIPQRSIAYGSLVNDLYNATRVGINLHAPEQCRGPALQLDCNNRLFDLAAAGCVQVSDNPRGVRTHFSEQEVFAEATPEAFVHRVFECLAAPDSSHTAMREAGRRRILAVHTWAHRGKTFLSWIK